MNAAPLFDTFMTLLDAPTTVATWSTIALTGRTPSESQSKLISHGGERGEFPLGTSERRAYVRRLARAVRCMLADGTQHRVDLLQPESEILELLDELDALDCRLVEHAIARRPSRRAR